MTLDEAIKHAEKMAEKKEIESNNWTYGASQINDDESRRKQYLKHAEMWHECAKEHRQLAEWLKELKRWREFGRNNAQFINDCLIQNRIDELYSSEIKNDADMLRIDNEVLMLRTTNELCKSFNERYERWEREQNDT